MNKSNKRERDILKLMRGFGVRVVEKSYTGGAHLKVKIKHPRWSPKIMIASLSVSDRRAAKNMASDLRRYVETGQ